MKFIQTILIVLAAFSFSNMSAQYATETRDVGSFTGVSVGGGIDVYITQGSSYEVKVETSDRVMDQLITEVRGDMLKIYFDGRVRNVKKSVVYLTVKTLEKISASGGSDIESRGAIKVSKFKINSSGGSDVELELYASDITVNTSGGSDVDLEGRANNLELSASGGSDFDGYKFKVKSATINASGGSDSNVFVTESINVRASGASDVNFKGNPKETKLKSSGASDIHSHD